MTNKIKIFHAQGYTGYSNWVPNKTIVRNLEDADLLFLEGGGDVGNEMYGEKRSKHLRPDLRRDAEEKILFEKAVALGIPIFGTCRGLQLIGALSGTSMIQHQPNPGFIHPIKTFDGLTLPMSSLHHNAINPYKLNKKDYRILAWTQGLCDFHLNQNDEEAYKKNEFEVEAAYFRKTNALGVQGHPEMIFGEKKYAATIEWTREQLFKLLNKEFL